jgi:hypothetical protein
MRTAHHTVPMWTLDQTDVANSCSNFMSRDRVPNRVAPSNGSKDREVIPGLFLWGVAERGLGIVWDCGTMHKGEPIRELEAHFGERLSLERLPPFAPVLNPVEA